MLAKTAFVWCALLAMAILNGALRETLLVPWLGAAIAHVVSTLVLCAAILLVARMTVAWIGPRTANEALLVGTIWMGLVLAFELLAGHFLFHRSWEYLLADYDVLRGRIWVLVPLATLFAPAITRRWTTLVS